VSHEGHPIEGVIKLLKELKQTVLEEGRAEEVTYAKFAQWCSSSGRSLEKAVDKSKEAVDLLETEIDATSKENTTLTEQIGKLDEEIAKYEKTDADSTKERDDAKKLYEKADADLESSIKAFDEVITEMKNAKASTSGLLIQAAARKALGSLSASALGSLSDSQLTRLQAVVGKAEPGDAKGEKEVPDFLAKGDYGGRVKKYEFKSDNVIELMEELKRNFEDERVEGTKRETAAQNAYDLAKNARDAALDAAKTSKGEKETMLGEVKSALAKVEGDLVNTKADLEADEQNLESTKTDCAMKKSEWEERSTLRQKEMEAIDAGVSILAKVTGVRSEAPTNPALPPSPQAALISRASRLRFPSLLQGTDPKAKAINLLRQEARRLQSQSFGRFAEELAAKVQGPFDDVNDMIQKMIFRLMEEQKDEDDHKNWCDNEMSKTNASKINKEEKIVELDLKLDEAKASVKLLTTAIQEADDAIAKLAAFMDEATEVRNAGKKENKAAIKDAKQAQDAIAQAVVVLEQFYKESGSIDKAFFLQARNAEPVQLSDKPSTWESSYSGVADPKQQPEGIITVLEKVSSDFSQMEADTKAQEVTDEKNYQEEMKTSKIEKARREKESEMKTQEKHRVSDKIASLEKSKKHTKEELGAVEQYLKDLSPACLEGDSTYEDRKSARVAEIEALKEAQVILADANDKPAPAPTALLLHSAATVQKPALPAPSKAAAAKHLRAVRKH